MTMVRINLSFKVLSIILIIFSLTLCAAIFANNLNARFYLTQKFGPRDPASVFSRIYANNWWLHGSGPGSDPKHAKEYVNLIQIYFNDPRFNTFVDLGSGDWQFMRYISIPNNKMYKGYEVVPSLVETVRQRYAKANVQFHSVKDLQDFHDQHITGDLLIVKDVMQHWPNSEIAYFLHNILPNFKYALITNDLINTFPPLNFDTELGGFRPLSLTMTPFNMKNVKIVLEYKGPTQKQVLLYTNPKLTKKLNA